MLPSIALRKITMPSWFLRSVIRVKLDIGGRTITDFFPEQMAAVAL
jgi:hypothetical protein